MGVWAPRPDRHGLQDGEEGDNNLPLLRRNRPQGIPLPQDATRFTRTADQWTRQKLSSIHTDTVQISKSGRRSSAIQDSGRDSVFQMRRERTFRQQMSKGSFGIPEQHGRTEPREVGGALANYLWFQWLCTKWWNVNIKKKDKTPNELNLDERGFPKSDNIRPKALFLEYTANCEKNAVTTECVYSSDIQIFSKKKLWWGIFSNLQFIKKYPQHGNDGKTRRPFPVPISTCLVIRT